jgi:Uma2 family endonuclease
MDTTRQSPDHPDMVKSVSDMEAIQQHSITVEEFGRMAESGVFGDRRIELINGRLIDVPPQGPPHAGTVSACVFKIQTALGRRAVVRPQLSLPVGADSQPEPDAAIVRWSDSFYRDRHPSAEETFAVVEVSHTTLTFDRDVKRQLYGAGRIPEYWIIDIVHETIEMYRQPHDLGYAWKKKVGHGDSVAFEAFPDVVFSVDELLG